MSLEYWFLLPVGMCIAFLAMSSGISSGSLWVPVYLLWVRFDAPVAFWITLATMLCGYGSGVTRNLRQGTIHGGFITRCLPFTVPAAVVGAYLSPALNVAWLILLFGVFVLGYGVRMLAQQWHQATMSPRQQERLPWRTAAVGGALLGLISVGLGELMLPRMLTDRKLGQPATVVGSAVLIIFVTSLAAAVARLNRPFVTTLLEQRRMLLAALVFAAPGVILGGQLGPMIARRFNARSLQLYVAVLLLFVGILMLVRFFAMTGFMG